MFQHAALCPLLLPVLSLGTEPVQTLPVTIRNYGISSDYAGQAPERGWLIVNVREVDHATDLDGDGEIGSTVLHLVDLSNDEVVNTGLASSYSAFSTDPNDPGRRVLALVPDPLEPPAARRVVYYDTRAKEVLETEIALALSPVSIDFNDSGLVFDLSEFLAALHLDSSESDLNGDADWDDSVTFWSDGFGSPRALATGRPVALRGSQLLATLSENGETELNGDQNLSDTVPAILDVTTFDAAVVPLSLGPWNKGLFRERNELASPQGQDWFAVRVFEAGQGNADLNGDGDDLDDVLHIYFEEQGVSINLGVAVDELIEAELVPGYDASAGADWLAYTVDERLQGEDLDGNGSREDHVFVLRDLQGSEPLLVRSSRYPTEIQQWGRYLSFWKLSPMPDAPWAFDVVDYQQRTLMIHDTLTGRTTRTRYTSKQTHPLDEETPLRYEVLAGPYVIHHRSEELTGLDLNADGDQEDLVLHVFDAVENETRNLGLLGTPSVSLEGHRAVLRFSETQVGVDLNGDGVLSSALAAVDLARGTSAFLPPTLQAPGYLADGDLLSSIHEQVLGEDLTGDGDTDDNLLVRVSIPWEQVR